MDSLLQKLKELQRKLQSVFPLEGSGREDELSAQTEFLHRLFDAKIVHEINKSFEGPLLVVVAGGTNVGKSEVFNALCGEKVSLPDPRAGRTRRPAVFTHHSLVGNITDPGFLRDFDRSELLNPEDLHRPAEGNPCFHFLLTEAPDKKGLVFVDSPDIDSNRLENLASARRLLAASDVIVFVTSPSKYNDEACVSFLDKTLALGRKVFVVFNFLEPDAEKVVSDFLLSVLDRRKETGKPEVVEVPRFPRGEDVFNNMTAHTGALAERITSLSTPHVKRQQASSTLTYIQREFVSVFDAVKQDIERIEDVAGKAEEHISLVRSDYEKNLTREPFYEIEAVFQEVLDHFSVPIVDDVLKAPGKAVKWIVRKVQGRDSERSETGQKVLRRKDQDRKKVAEITDALRSTILKTLAEGSSDPLLAEVLRRANQGALGEPAERNAEQVWDEMEPAFLRWKEEMRLEIIEKIQASPNLKALLKTSKAVLQVGSGVLVVVLTGGVGPSDLVIGPVTAKLTQYVLETFGSAYFSGKRDAYLELHMERFDAIIEKLIREPLRETFPKKPDIEEMENTKKALLDFQIPTK